MKKFTVLCFVAGLFLAAGLPLAGPAAAAETHSNCINFDPYGNATLTPNCTQTISVAGGGSQSFPAADPCTGDPGLVTQTVSRQVYHINVDGAGDAWDSGTINGTVAFAPTDSSKASGAGTFTIWFGDSFNAKNMVQTFTASNRLQLSNGQHLTIHGTGHVTFTPNGPAVSFDKRTITCN